MNINLKYEMKQMLSFAKYCYEILDQISRLQNTNQIISKTEANQHQKLSEDL